MGVGYWVQAIKLACAAVLVGLVVGRWSVWWGVFVGVLVFWLLLAQFVGDKQKPPSGV